MHSSNTSGNGQNITAATKTTTVVTLPSLPSEGTPTACDGTYINGGWYARWYASPALVFSSSQPDGTLAQR